MTITEVSVQGVVDKVFEKPWQDKTFYSFTLQGGRGFYRTGERRPSVLVEGASIQFDSQPSKDGKATDAKNVTAWVGEPVATGQTVKSFVNPKDKYWEDREARDVTVQKRIDLHARRNSAIAMAKLVVEAGAVPAPKKPQDYAEILEKLVAHYTKMFAEQGELEDNTPNTPAEAVVEQKATTDDWN